MKKFLAFVCMVTCIFGLSACGAEKTSTAAEDTKGQIAQELAVNVIAPYFADNFMGTDYAENFMANCTVDEMAYYVEADFAQVASAVGFDKLSFDGLGVKSAVNSFDTAYDDMGKVVSYDTENVSVKVDKNEITVNIPVVCEKKSGSIEIIYNSKRFLSVNTVTINAKMSTAEIGKKSALNTLLGMGTVFSVLVLIMCIISAFTLFSKIEKRMADKKAGKEAVAAPAPVATVTEEAEDLTDDLELIAVISAAIAASEGAASTDGFVVRSIRRAR